jgi:membrane protease YdiL (CAAX protease family)
VTHIIALALAAPVTEEIVFRGFLYRGFSESRIGVAGTIALTVAWALIHIVQGTAVLIDTATLPSWTLSERRWPPSGAHSFGSGGHKAIGPRGWHRELKMNTLASRPGAVFGFATGGRDCKLA